MYTQRELAQYIGLKDAPVSWDNCYSIAIIQMPEKIIWLESEDIEKSIKFYHLKKERAIIKNLFETAERIKCDEKLKIVAWLLHYILYIDKTKQIFDIWNWGHNTEMFSVLGNNMLPLIVLLSGREYHIKNMREREYDKTLKKASINGVRQACLKDRNIFGLSGIRFSQMTWGAYFVIGRLIQIKNLQYELFIDPDLKMRRMIANLNRRYYKDNEIKCGGNNVFVKVHIPKQKKLHRRKVIISLRKSEKIINKFYPFTRRKTIHYFCESWLLSKELDFFLSSNSNIIKFKTLFNTCSEKNGGRGFYKFLFNQFGIINDTKNLPENTSLQRNVKAYIQIGKTLNDGYGLLKEDILKR